MSRRNDANSVRIIDHKKYIVEKRNLLCKVNIRDSKTWIDLFSKTVYLYHPHGKAFILETVSDATGNILESKLISECEAKTFMNNHPDCICEKVYERFFGKPSEP